MSSTSEPSFAPRRDEYSSSSTQHLQRKMNDLSNTAWTFWASTYNRTARGLSKDKYLDFVKPVSTFRNFNGFRSSWEDLLVDVVPWSNSIYIFREGISPLWEVPENIAGGKFVIPSGAGHENAIELFHNLIVSLISGDIGLLGDVTGVIISFREWGGTLAVWNSVASDNDQIMRIRSGLERHCSEYILYQPHQVSIAANDWHIQANDRTSNGRSNSNNNNNKKQSTRRSGSYHQQRSLQNLNNNNNNSKVDNSNHHHQQNRAVNRPQQQQRKYRETGTRRIEYRRVNNSYNRTTEPPRQKTPSSTAVVLTQSSSVEANLRVSETSLLHSKEESEQHREVSEMSSAVPIQSTLCVESEKEKEKEKEIIKEEVHQVTEDEQLVVESCESINESSKEEVPLPCSDDQQEQQQEQETQDLAIPDPCSIDDIICDGAIQSLPSKLSQGALIASILAFLGMFFSALYSFCEACV